MKNLTIFLSSLAAGEMAPAAVEVAETFPIPAEHLDSLGNVLGAIVASILVNLFNKYLKRKTDAAK